MLGNRKIRIRNTDCIILGGLCCRIMHECVAKLLKATDEESLECLCRLMTTVGQTLEQDTKERLQKGGEAFARLRPIEFYFQEMVVIINEKKTSSRVRFLMQDCVDLRRNNWQKRREDAGPKTIDQIHEEAKKEQLKEKLNMMAPAPMPPPSSRGGGGGRDARDDPRKRSLKGGSGGGQGEDGWQAVPTRAAKITNEKVDTTRIRNIVSKRDNIEEIQLGPPSAKAGGGFSKWSGGSSGPKTSSSRYEEPAVAVMHNRFSAFSSSGGGESSGPPSANYDGRTSGGLSRGSRPLSSSGSSGAYTGRPSRGQSSESDRAKALQVGYPTFFLRDCSFVLFLKFGHLGGELHLASEWHRSVHNFYIKL